MLRKLIKIDAMHQSKLSDTFYSLNVWNGHDSNVARSCAFADRARTTRHQLPDNAICNCSLHCAGSHGSAAAANEGHADRTAANAKSASLIVNDANKQCSTAAADGHDFEVLACRRRSRSTVTITGRASTNIEVAGDIGDNRTFSVRASLCRWMSARGRVASGGMNMRKLPIAFLLVSGPFFYGCAQTPSLQAATGSDNPKILMRDVIKRIKCEIADAFDDKLDGQYPWLATWTAKVDLTLQVSEIAGTSPAVSYTKILPNAFKYGAGSSSLTSNVIGSSLRASRSRPGVTSANRRSGPKRRHSRSLFVKFRSGDTIGTKRYDVLSAPKKQTIFARHPSLNCVVAWA